MKYFLSGLLITISLLALNCKSNSDNPVTTSTNTYSGVFNISSFTYTGSTVDSIVVSLNLNGNNGILSGTGTITYGRHETGNDIKIVVKGNAAGAYSDSNINVSVTDNTTSNKFVYSGTNSSANSTNYSGTALIITSTDTLTFTGISLYKSN